ncbi:hypothetical protein [Hyphomonas sp.]|uniref:hypothetical protein n=1 Tax=Hyphomonas sp. TaxID=87 RepID=UPI0025BC45C6|nr:hypothetical protein [Hyphomonas sp.]MBI1401467.1 hypothetical protein [Hyphomonas sp.]
MNAATLAAALDLAGMLFKVANAAIERSDSATAKKVAALGKAVVSGVQTSGRIDEAVAKDVRGLADALDADGLPDRAAWDQMAAKVRTAADRWNAAG